MERKPTFEITDASPNIISYLSKPGIYRLKEMSATGKTYLCKSLKMLRTIGYPVNGYDYYDFLEEKPIEKFIRDKVKLVVIDRYDMYNGKLKAYLPELAKNCVVLIDCKSTPIVGTHSKIASITFNKNEFIIE